MAETPEKTENPAPDIAAATLLKQLGYDVDAGGPLYYLSLARFLQSITDAEKKEAETPAGLLLVLHRRLDAKKNAEVPKEEKTQTPAFWIGLGVATILAVLIIKQTDSD